ncbi:cupin domain-containing protein [Polaribacter septentrionalilitoris]|uniref:cupin domain-containing protein n=1 Tax=Polaribacter septentrionalilitoris TaxID=2494657 RepID=UPI001357DC76|nr:cupin domain-containing protein [Polaribacter septentrionalilitoris]
MRINDINPKEIIAGFNGRFVHMETFTIAFWEVKKGAEIPKHSHIHEQTTQVTEGEFEMTVDGITKIYTPGSILKIPSLAKHSGKALTDCKITDVFCPVREEYQ